MIFAQPIIESAFDWIKVQVESDALFSLQARTRDEMNNQDLLMNSVTAALTVGPIVGTVLCRCTAENPRCYFCHNALRLLCMPRI